MLKDKRQKSSEKGKLFQGRNKNLPKKLQNNKRIF